MSDSIEALTAERGSDYGPPLEHFDGTQAVYEEWLSRWRHAGEGAAVLSLAERRAVQHAVYFIIDKLIRACRSPKKRDHWQDVAGYARTVEMALGLTEGES